MDEDIEDMTKGEAADAVGELLGIEIAHSRGSTVTRDSWTNVLGYIFLNGSGIGPKFRKLTKPQAAAAVGAILDVETTDSTGSTVTEDSWKNVLQELRNRHNVS